MDLLIQGTKGRGDADSESSLVGLAWGTCALRQHRLWPVLLGQAWMHVAEAETGGNQCHQPHGPQVEGHSPQGSENIAKLIHCQW